MTGTSSASAGKNTTTTVSNKTASPAKSDAETGTDTPVLVSDTVSDEISSGPAPVAGDVPDPRTASDSFTEGDQAGYAGRSGFDQLASPVGAIPYVDPANKLVDVTPGVQPDSGTDKLLAAAQLKAPNLTRAFVDAYGLTNHDLAEIAQGAVPPPPAIGPVHTSDLHLTPGGWVQTPPGISPEEYAATRAGRIR